MNASEAALLVNLLRSAVVGVLAVLIDGKPYQGLVPFAFVEEDPAFLVHVSALARHTQGLTPGAPYSLLIHGEPRDPLQTLRASFSGAVEMLSRDTAAYQTARQRYLARFPKAQITFTLPDFRLIRLSVTEVRFVAGFARAYSFSPAQLQHWLQEIAL